MTMYAISKIDNMNVQEKYIFYHNIVWDNDSKCCFYFKTKKSCQYLPIPKEHKRITGSQDLEGSPMVVSSLYNDIVSMLFRDNVVKIKSNSLGLSMI